MKNHLLFVIILLFSAPVSVAQERFWKDNIQYVKVSINSENVRVRMCNCDEGGKVVIPGLVEYEGHIYKVTEIGPYDGTDGKNVFSPYLEHVEIPNTVEFINSGAFSGCRCLMAISIPNSVKKIGKGAYSECKNLKSIKIPNSVKEIGDEAFSDCSQISHVVLSDSITKLSKRIFSGCSKLDSITIPNSVTAIEDYAFAYCKSLNKIVLPNSVESIGNGVFSGCASLPVIDGVRYADTYAVSVVNKDTTSCNLKPDTKFIGIRAFYNCSNLNSVEIPISVKQIHEEAFAQCTNLLFVELPDSLTTIGSAAFSRTSLTTVKIPDSVKTIGGSAFYGCKSLTTAWIGNSVTYIGYKAFGLCPNLRDIYIYVTNPGTIETGENVFFIDGDWWATNRVYTDGKLHVPVGCVDVYRKANEWKKFWHIEEDETSNICVINKTDRNNKSHNLTGILVSDGYKGIIIKNGKKLLKR